MHLCAVLCLRHTASIKCMLKCVGIMLKCVRMNLFDHEEDSVKIKLNDIIVVDNRKYAQILRVSVVGAPTVLPYPHL